MTDEINSLTRLEEALGRLGAEHEPPKGWEDRVLDVVDNAQDAAELADVDLPAAAATDPSDVLPWPGTGNAASAAHDRTPPPPIADRTTEAVDVQVRDARETIDVQVRDACESVDAVQQDACKAADAQVRAREAVDVQVRDAREPVDAVRQDARQPVAVAHAQDPADALLADAADAADAAVLMHRAARRRRWQSIAAVDAVGMAAAGACIILGLAGPDLGRPAQGKLALEVALQPVGPKLRRGSHSAHVGDVVHATAAGGAGHRALWVYHDDRLVLVCPGPHDCREPGDATIADVVLRAPGTYMFVALASPAELPVPRGQFDSDVAGAQAAGVDTETSRIAVR
jgi:hypothetical protein